MAKQDNIKVLKEGVKEYIYSEKSKQEIIQSIKQNLGDLIIQAEKFQNLIKESLEEYDFQYNYIFNKSFGDQLQTISNIYHSYNNVSTILWKQGLSFQKVLNKTLGRRIIGSLTCIDDGSIRLYSQHLLEQIILQGESHITQTKKSLDLNNNIKKAQLSLDQELQKLQQRIDHAVNIYGPLYTLMVNRYEYKNMDFKKRKDYQLNDSSKYYWWPSPDINNTELSASQAITNRGFLGEVYTSYILDRKDADLRLASIHINNSIYTKRQNSATQSALGGTNKYIGNQDNLPGVAQGDISIIFNGTRIQIAVKSQTLVGKKYSSEALGPIIAMATLIITYKEKNYTDLATLLCELFYQDFLNNKTMTTGERLLNVAIKKANKIFNESMTTPSIII